MASMVLSTVAAAALGAAVAAGEGGMPTFTEWTKVHGRTYATEEERVHREALYKQTIVRLQERNAAEGALGATYFPGPFADKEQSENPHRGGCLSPSDAAAQPADVLQLDEFLSDPPSPQIDWRAQGAVTPVQQQHPFGTCWAFSMIAATEGVAVVQGKQKLEKLSEQMVVSCVPAEDCGQNSDVLWKWLVETTDGRVQHEDDYVYNRTCNFFREQLLAPDGTRDGYMMNCTLPDDPPYGPCPPCPGITRKDGTPPCQLDPKTAKFADAKIGKWSFVPGASDGDTSRMLAALHKYGPCQIGIDASCLSGYTGGVITNCTSANVDHAVTIVGADVDRASGHTYWIIKNSWNTTFGEDGYFRVARDTNPPQMGINGGYFGCYNSDCSV